MRHGVLVLLVAGGLAGCGGTQESSLEPAAPPAPAAPVAACDSVSGEAVTTGAGGVRLPQGGCSELGGGTAPRVATEPGLEAELGADGAGSVCAQVPSAALPAPPGYVAAGADPSSC